MWFYSIFISAEVLGETDWDALCAGWGSGSLEDAAVHKQWYYTKYTQCRVGQLWFCSLLFEVEMMWIFLWHWLSYSSILTCLCQGVRMNDSSPGNCVFHSILSAKREINPIFETRGGGATTCGGVSVSLLQNFSAETLHIGCFFVAFLKFPPIVQSGSILFRKLDLGRAGRRARPALARAPLAEVLMCGQWRRHLMRRVTENSATF